jgi:hypothetical protein
MTTALINRPPQVQSAVSAVIAACRNWPPTEVPAVATLLPPAPSPQTSEALICGFIQHPFAQLWEAIIALIILVITVTLIGWVFQLHRLPGATWRLARRRRVAL